MNIPVPNLDDRTFDDLVAEGLARAARSTPEWTDHSVHDPGVVLIEVFAHLTEIMLYRLNRLPEKAYVEFLNLLGVRRHPPSAAWATVVISRNPGSDPNVPIVIPAGAQVAAARADGADGRSVVFTVTTSAVLPAGQNEISIPVHHCDLVDGELLGLGTGLPGQSYRTAKAPIVTTTEAFDVLLGVETDPQAVAPGVPAREFNGRTFEIWQPVSTFAGAAPGAKVYLLDRATGTVTFAPALELRTGGRDGLTTVAAVPPANREIRIWYRTGGGPAGNVAAGTLTGLRGVVGPVSASNPAPARGGRAMESIESVRTRGPYEFFAQQRAVTARDFEVLAVAGSPAIARARAFTRVAMWSFARAGEVEVVLVPYVSDEARPGWRLSPSTLADHQGEAARQQAQADLDSRRALGTRVVTTWARYKPVAVRARLVVRPEDDVDAVRARVLDRLYQTISPLPTPVNPSGWGFGEPLWASNVYRWLESAEPGVQYVDSVEFVVPDAPDGRVRSVAADAYQADTWYAGCGEILFRSTNGANGWEPVARWEGEEVRRVVPAPAAIRPGIVARPGLVAALTRAGSAMSRVYVSTDLGESWQRVLEFAAGIADIAWVDRDGVPVLLLATSAGLYEARAEANAVPLQIQVGPQEMSCNAVRSFVTERGVAGVMVAGLGLYVSLANGRSGTFVEQPNLRGIDIRALAVQYDGPVTVLWAGAAELDPTRPGRGCFRARLSEANLNWQSVTEGWLGGTCWSLDFRGRIALATAQSGGLLRLDTGVATPRWQPADVNAGLPLRDRNRFRPVEAVAVGAGGTVLVGTERGVYRSPDAVTFSAASHRRTTDNVTVPDTWLLCSGEHDIEVVRANA
jgi:hypothetical protein